MINYAITNFIDSATIIDVSSEDSIYTRDLLWNVRPSYPFRWLGQRASPKIDPEWVCLDFGEVKSPTLVAAFNHNLIGSSSGSDIRVKAADFPCPDISGAGSWDLSGSYDESILDRLVTNHRNLYKKITPGSYQYFMLQVSDVDVFIPQLGELFFGQWQQFSSDVHLQPGRSDGPDFIFGQQQTHWGQDWVDFRSETQARFTLNFKNLGTQSLFDEFHLFLRNVAENNGKFIFIPNDSYPFVYYVVVKNIGQAVREVSGSYGYLRNWQLELKTLTEGIQLTE